MNSSLYRNVRMVQVEGRKQKAFPPDDYHCLPSNVFEYVKTIHTEDELKQYTDNDYWLYNEGQWKQLGITN